MAGNAKYGKALMIPRVLAIAYALFVLVFSFDDFGSGSTGQQTTGFIIHSMPSILLIAAVVSAWNKPKLCGVLFLAVAAVFAVFLIIVRLRAATLEDMILQLSLLSGIPAVIGALFLILGRKKKEG